MPYINTTDSALYVCDKQQPFASLHSLFKFFFITVILLIILHDSDYQNINASSNKTEKKETFLMKKLANTLY